MACGEQEESRRGSFKKRPADCQEAPAGRLGRGRFGGCGTSRSAPIPRSGVRPLQSGCEVGRGAGVTSATTCGPLNQRGGGGPAPAPAVEKYRGAQVPAPFPAPGPPPALPGPPGKPPPAGPGPGGFSLRPWLRGAGRQLGVAPRLLGPCPHLWPPEPALRAPRREVGMGRAQSPPRVAAPKELHGPSPFPKSTTGSRGQRAGERAGPPRLSVPGPASPREPARVRRRAGR